MIRNYQPQNSKNRPLWWFFQATHAWWGGFGGVRAKAEFDVCFREFAMCVCHKPSFFGLDDWGCTKQRMATICSDLVLVMLSWHLSVRWVSCFISDSRWGGIRMDQMLIHYFGLQQWKKIEKILSDETLVESRGSIHDLGILKGPICWRDYHA